MVRIDTIHSILQSVNSTEQVLKHNFPPEYFQKKIRDYLSKMYKRV